MAVSEHHAKRLLRELRGRTEILLEQRKYWDLTFLRVYLDHCDGVLFDDPRAGLALAKAAPELARLIPERSPAEWQYCTPAAEKRQHRELLIRSLAVLGGAHRAGGRFAEADKAYEEACRICDSQPVSSTTRANLYKRLCKLRSAQKRHGEALALVDYAIEIYREKDPEYLCDAVLNRGFVLFRSGRSAEAILCFGEALSLAKARPSASFLVRRTFQSAVHNLAAAATHGCRAEDLSTALGYVNQAKKFFARKPGSINKYKLLWVEGRLAGRLGSTRLAERRFLRAFKQFLNLGAPVEAAMVGLDLAMVYHQHGQWQELEAIAAEIYTRYRELDGGTEGLAALRLWVDGAAMNTRNRAMIVKARQALEQLAVQRKP